MLSFDPEPEATPPAPADGATEPGGPDPGDDPKRAQAAVYAAAALRHFLKDEHRSARQAVEKALALDPANARALELRKILSVLG